MSDLYTRFDAVFFEKTRLSIVTLLYKEEQTFNRLKYLMEMTDGALYTHMEKLLAGGYAEKTKVLFQDSAQTVYRLTDKGQQTFEEYLDFLETTIMNRKGGKG